jgi:hypothetical protein
MADRDLPQKPPPIGKLNTVKACRIELAKVYKDARSGKIEPSDGTRLAFILSQIAKLIESSDLEQRFEIVEKQLESLHRTTHEKN